MKLKSLRIGVRLALGFGAVIALLLAIVALAGQQLAASSDGVTTLLALEERATAARDWTARTQLNVARAVAIAKAGGLPEVERHFAPEMKRTSAEINVLQAALERQIVDADGKALLAAVAAQRQAYLATRERLLGALKQGDPAAAEALLTAKMLPASQAYLAAMQAVQAHVAALTAADAQRLQRATARAGETLLLLAGAAAALGAALSFWIARSITRPLQRGIEAARVIAGGDLSRPLDSTRGDEAGDLLRALGRMQAALRGLVGQVRVSTDSIGTASAEIAVGNQDLSARTEETASSLQQTAASMEQLTGTVKLSADAARQADRLARSAAEVAGRGGAVVAEVVATMDEINAASAQIADIVGVIDGIAFQTNLLALNAAVEAARAGEQGRGFAVVAGEVRSLAQRSADAAKQIRGLIGASVGKVEGGARLVADAGTTMTEIVDSVQRVSAMIAKISAAATEQSAGLGEVNGSVTRLDRMTQQNAALVEQSTAAAESLKAQAADLSSALGAFRLESAAA